MGCGVWGVGCGVWGVGCGVWGVGCGVWGVGCGVWGVGCGVWGVGCGVWGVGCGAWGLGRGAWGVGCGVWGLSVCATPQNQYEYTSITISTLFRKTPHTQVPFALGHYLRNFSITVGPHQGVYKRCGSDINAMSKEDTKSFRCEPNARGMSLVITMRGTDKILELCEVQILGKGIVTNVISLHRN